LHCELTALGHSNDTPPTSQNRVFSNGENTVFFRQWIMAGFAVALLETGPAQASVIDFETGGFSGDTFVQNGFVFTSIKNGNGPVSIPSGQCIDTKCLNIRNRESVSLTFTGGAFSLSNFFFNTDGRGSGVIISLTLNGPGQLFSFNQGGQPFTLAQLVAPFTNVTQIFFRHADNGTVRIDDIGAVPAAVPAPAAGGLLLLGLGGLAALRRRKA
jgi:hypothetical protein